MFKYVYQEKELTKLPKVSQIYQYITKTGE